MRLGLLAVLVALTAGTARAGNITIEFSGILTLASGIDGADAGTGFSGSYTYDPSAALQTLSASSGLYSFTSFPTTGFSLTVLAPTPVTFTGTPLRDITVNDAAGGDSLTAIASGAGGDFRMDVNGGPSMLSSLALVVPDFSQTGGTLQYTNLAAGFVLLMGSTTSMSAAVPEPSSALLVGLGLAALAARRRGTPSL
jgi:hypothetical protein